MVKPSGRLSWMSNTRGGTRKSSKRQSWQDDPNTCDLSGYIAIALGFLKLYLKTLCFCLLSRAVYMRCLMWSDVISLFPIISYQRSRQPSKNKIRMHVFVLSNLFCLVSWCHCSGTQNVSMDTSHWAGDSLIILLPTAWKTGEKIMSSNHIHRGQHSFSVTKAKHSQM